MIYCHGCGAEIHETALSCPKCGAPQGAVTGVVNESPKSRLASALFCWFLGFLSIHRFYVGKPGTAILQIVTFGGLGIWWLIDFIMILCGSFTDGDGRKVTRW